MQNGHRPIKPRVQSMNITSITDEDFNMLPQIAPENVPVLRRKKYTKQNRKSFGIEPNIGLILAVGAAGPMSSSEEEIESATLPSNRKKYAGRRNLKKRYYSTSNLKGNGNENDENDKNQIGTKSLSVRDLNGDNIDFNNRDSVKKWTSQIFAELESIPSSRRGSMDVTKSMTTQPPELIINLATPSYSSASIQAPPSPMKRRRFPVLDDELLSFEPNHPVPSPRTSKKQPEEVVGPTFLRDLLTASCSQYSESNCSDKLATSDTATQRPSRASSFEWMNAENAEHGKYEQCSSDEADREVASIGMSKQSEALQRKKNLEELERSVNELENLGNSSWFPTPPPPPDEARDQIFDSLPASFRNRRPENRKNAVGSVYENASSSISKLSSEPKSQQKSIKPIDKPFSLENLPMVQRLSELSALKNQNSSKKEVTNKHNTFALQLSERDAVDACSWLRKAGFSKYADQFDEGKLPLQPSQDPTLLEADLRSLNRRIAILNKCHSMKVDSVPMRRRMNNEFPRLDPMKVDDNSVYSSDSWRYGGGGPGIQYSNTWSRPSGSDHVYSGSLARIPNSTSTWHRNTHQMAEPTRDSRKVLRTDWYDAHNTPNGRHNDSLDTASTAACVNEMNSKLQRSQSERIKDRARAIMKKMDLRSTNKRPKESRSRPAPMNIGDPVLVSYDTPKNSIRSHHIDRPSILPERGRQLYQTSPYQTPSRSKSIAQNRRGGLVFITPTSPDSLDNSFGYSDTNSSVVSSLRSNGNYGESRRRELSMPPPSRHRVQMNGPYPPIPDGTLRRREIMPFDSYLYPGHHNLLERTYETPRNLIPDRMYDDLDSLPPKSSKTNSNSNSTSNSLDNKKTDNISMFNDGYYTHEIKTALPRAHNISKPENLKVNTEKIEVLSSSDEPIGRTTLTKRSDSGLGSSLSRSPSGPHTQRIRQSLLPYSNATSSGISSAYSCCSWGSSTKLIDDQPFFAEIELARSIDSLNVIEMSRLRKTAFTKLSIILERNMDGKAHLSDPDQDELPSKHVWSVHRLIKRMKINDGQKSHKDSEEGAIFGVGLDTIFNRTGYFLPRPILEVMKFLRNIAPETVGIFRKNGVKSRIAELRSIIESYSGNTDVFVGENMLDSTQVHDVADLLKQYFRDLPEPLMTVKMSEVFANICSVVPDVERITALQYAIALLPDENREALKSLLLFLKEVSRNSQVNNMTAQNLSVCFTPSLFQLGASRLDKATPGSRRHKTVGATGLPSEKEMKEARACQLCLTMLIEYVQTVFMVPDILEEHADAEDDLPNLADLGLKGPRSFLVDRVIDMIREHSDGWKNWTVEGTFRGIEVSSRRPADTHPLKTFRVWLDIPAGPKSVMMRILKERYSWDTSVINWRHLEYVSAPDTDIHQYVINETIGHPTRDCHVARFHSSGLTEIRGACAISERSVKCSEDQLLGGVAAIIFDQRFLIEPVSGGQSRVNYIARVDLKGRSIQWYNKSFGSIMCRHLERLRESFLLGDKGGPETNV